MVCICLEEENSELRAMIGEIRRITREDCNLTNHFKILFKPAIEISGFVIDDKNYRTMKGLRSIRFA